MEISELNTPLEELTGRVLRGISKKGFFETFKIPNYIKLKNQGINPKINCARDTNFSKVAISVKFSPQIYGKLNSVIATFPNFCLKFFSSCF